MWVNHVKINKHVIQRPMYIYAIEFIHTYSSLFHQILFSISKAVSQFVSIYIRCFLILFSIFADRKVKIIPWFIVKHHQMFGCNIEQTFYRTVAFSKLGNHKFGKKTWNLYNVELCTYIHISNKYLTCSFLFVCFFIISYKDNKYVEYILCYGHMLNVLLFHMYSFEIWIICLCGVGSVEKVFQLLCLRMDEYRSYDLTQ